MTFRTAWGVLAFVWLAGSCGTRSDGTLTLPADRGTGTERSDEPPVALNAEPPVTYPEALLEQRIGGTVVLRLFVDDAGSVLADSVRVQESSGYPALDSAALAAAALLRFAPALRDGRPVATPFLQPFTFRAPPSGGGNP